MAYLSSERDGGFWTGKLWPALHLELGKLYLNYQDTSNSLHHLNAALKYWQEADRDFLKAREAHQLISFLATTEVAEIH